MATELERQLLELKQGDHVCPIYEGRAEQLAIVVPIIKEGLGRGERCLFVADDANAAEVRLSLASAGVDVAREVERGALSLPARWSPHLQGGTMDCHALFRAMGAEEARALADGFSGLRLCLEKSWALGVEMGIDRLIAFETSPEAAFPRSVRLCLYDRTRFDPVVIHDVLRIHPVVIVGGYMGPNPYYEPPELLSSQESQVTSEFKRKRVAWWISRLKRARATERERERALEQLRQAEQALRRSERELHLVVDTIPVMAWSTRPDGVVDFLNRRWLAYSDLSLEQYVADPTGPIHPEDVARVIGKWRTQLAAGEAYDDEMRLRRADGEYRWFLVRTAPLRDEHGRVLKWYGVSTDIEERKRAEQTVWENRELLQSVLSTLPVGVEVTDRAGDILLVNAASKRIWGDVIVSGRDRRAQCTGYWHESGERIEPEAWASVRAIRDGHTSLNELIDIETAGGQRKIIRNSAAPVRDADGTIVGAVVVNEDVTERVRAGEKLKLSERRLAEAQRVAHIGSWEWDPRTDELTWSDELYRVFGVPPDFRLSYEAFLNLVAPADRERVRGRVDAAIRERRGFAGDFQITGTGKGARVLYHQASMILDEAGMPIRLVGTCQDVTERERAEEALRESNRKLDEAQRIAHVGYWDWDLVTDQLVYSGEVCRMFGTPPEQCTVNREGWLAHILPQDRERTCQALDAAQRGGPRYDMEYRAVRPSGEVRVIHCQGDVTRDHQGRPLRMFGVVQDVTERKRGEEALAESADRLHHLSRRLLEVQEEERRHISRELHDEFGQLLATAALHLHAARTAAGEAARPHLDECAALLRRAGDQVRSLALELRPTMLETAGLDAALRWLAEQHQRQTGIATQVAGHANGVAGDLAIACFRVVQEGLTNVVKHAGAQHVRIELTRTEANLELAVRDDGVGFDVRRALEPAAGSGRLGLIGMRERVEILGGRLEVDSEPGRGTRVCASFPLAESGG